MSKTQNRLQFPFGGILLLFRAGGHNSFIYSWVYKPRHRCHDFNQALSENHDIDVAPPQGRLVGSSQGVGIVQSYVKYFIYHWVGFMHRVMSSILGIP